MKKQTYIYALKDPGTNEIRYVGKSNNPEDRVIKHYSERVGSKKMLWMKSLKIRGLKPELVILEKCDAENYRPAEVSWIHFFLDMGCNLTNAIYPGYSNREMLRTAAYLSNIV